MPTQNIDTTPRTLFMAADAAINAVEQALPHHLQKLLVDLRASWRARLPEHAQPGDLFSSPLGTPALPLLRWLGRALSLSEDALQQATTAMLLLYFSVRCQDDVIDEDANPALLYLQHALQQHALSRLSQLSGHTDLMMEHADRILLRFLEASTADHALRTSPDPRWNDADLQQQGHKYLPMALPLIALAIHAQKTTIIPTLQLGVETLGVGLQLLNDILGAERDLRSRLRSPWLHELRLSPAQHSPADILPATRRALQRKSLQPYFLRIQNAYHDALSILQEIDPLPQNTILQEHVHDRLRALQKLEIQTLMRASRAVPTIFADIELTRRCNLRCPACFVFAQEENLQTLAELPLSVVLDALEELAGYNTLLHLTGGEPFMYPHLWEVLQRAVELGFSHVMINTNGLYLSQETLLKLANLPLQFRLLVSIDGPPGFHEEARGRSTTAKTLDAIRRANEAGLRAEPATILSAGLVQYGIPQWKQWLHTHIGHDLHLTLWPLFLKPTAALPRGGVGDMLSQHDLRAAAQQIAPFLTTNPPSITVADYPVINPLLARLGVPQERLWQCDAGRGRLCLQSDMTVTPCHPFRLPIETLSPNTVPGFVARTLQASTYQKLGERNHQGCASCPEKKICGNCQAVVVGKNLPLFSNDEFCRSL